MPRTDAWHSERMPEADPRIAQVLRNAASVKAMQPVFQPIYNLLTSTVVGAEALARWPDAPGVDPSAVIGEAREQGRICEIDQACRNASLHAATAQGHLDDGVTIFINAEPDALVQQFRSHEVFTVPTHGVRVILELTERALLDDPAQLLNVVSQAREQGLGIALDDVGKNPDSLTLLSLIGPDVVKIDGSLISGPPTREQLHVITAVNAYAEATGAAILAEGIETEDHRRRALEMGATLGQGWLLGRPAALPPTRWPPVGVDERVRMEDQPLDIPDRPSHLIRDNSPAVNKSVLVRYSRYLEEQALSSSDPLTILASVQSADHFTDAVADRYSELAAAHRLVAVIGTDMPPNPATGVRGTGIPSEHPLADEWTLVLVGRHFFAALLARDLHAANTGSDRQFDYMLTFDRATVTAAARALLQHMH